MRRALLFDLDGTLANTAPELHAAASAAMRELGLAPVPLAEARGYIGDGMPRFIKRLLTREWRGEPDAALFDAMQRLMAQHYMTFCGNSVLYDGVLERLQSLTAGGGDGDGDGVGDGGYALACVTNKPERYTGAVLSALGVAGCFRAVVCGDTLPVKKPDAAPLLHALRQLNATVDDAVMIGDSLADSRAAAAAGCPFIFMRYGYHRGDEPPPADFVAESFSEISDSLLATL